MNESEQLEACRQRAAERIDAGKVRISLDWRPTITDHHISFLCSIIRNDLRSTLEFVVDLARLAPGDLAHLHSILSQRHAGMDNAREIAQAVSWLLNLSLQQSSTLTLPDRQAGHQANALNPMRSQAARNTPPTKHQVDPDHLAGFPRVSEHQAFAKELAKPKERATQFQLERELSSQTRCELLPRTRAVYRVGNQPEYDPRDEHPQPLPQGEPVSEGQFIERVTGRGQSITCPPEQPDPPSVPDGTPEFSLEPPPVRDLLRPGDDNRPFLEQPLPPPSAEDMIAHTRLFLTPLVENCDRFARDLDWESGPNWMLQ
jgi:hypothetical protein